MPKAKAKAKASRKGKREWRRNISTEDHDRFIQEESKLDRSGGRLTEVPDTQIFFLDKEQNSTLQRKVDKQRSKVLNCDRLLQRNSLIPVVEWPTRNKGKLKKTKTAAVSVLTTTATATVEKEEFNGDLWEEQAPSISDEETGFHEVKVTRMTEDLNTERRHKAAPAVEVDIPGCSYNPGFDDHQDALGIAVAQELQKELKKELQPEAPPIKIMEAEARAHMGLNEEDMYFLEAGIGAGQDGEEEEEEDEGEGEGGPLFVSKPVLVNRLTRADLNRKLRRKAAEEAQKNKRKRKDERKELERLKEIEAEMGLEEETKTKRRERRDASRIAKQASMPPTLGPHKFEPESVKVLLTEEVNGSLRKLKGCSTLARERFKSFQRRGLVEPRVPVKRRQAKNRRIVIQGSQGQKEREMHQEILAMRAERQKGKDLEVFE